MAYYLIVCKSLTFAQRIRSTLERGGISAWLTRTPASISPSGCSYCVKIRQRDLEKSLRLLKKFKLPYVGIFIGGKEGYREVAP